MAANEDVLAVRFAARNFSDDVIDLDVFTDAVFEAEFDLDGAFLEEAFEEQRVFFAKITAGDVGHDAFEIGVAHQAGSIVCGADAEDEAARAFVADHAKCIKEPAEAAHLVDEERVAID